MNIKKRWTPEKIDLVVGKLLKKWKSSTDQKTMIMDTLWEKVVGPQVANHTKVAQIAYGKLTVLAENSTWMNELTFMKETIKIKAKSLFLEHNIQLEEVVFKIGKGK